MVVMCVPKPFYIDIGRIGRRGAADGDRVDPDSLDRALRLLQLQVLDRVYSYHTRPRYEKGSFELGAKTTSKLCVSQIISNPCVDHQKLCKKHIWNMKHFFLWCHTLSDILCAVLVTQQLLRYTGLVAFRAYELDEIEHLILNL